VSDPWKWFRRMCQVWLVVLWMTVVGVAVTVVAPPTARAFKTILVDTGQDMWYCAYATDPFGNIWYVCYKISDN
jgi:hypothetical protein